METNIKKWGLVSISLALLVISLIAFRMMTTFPESGQEEILTTSADRESNATKISQDEILLRLTQMENLLKKKRSQGDGSSAAPASADTVLLQHQIDSLTQQVSELTKAISASGAYTAPQRKDELKQLQTATNDPIMRQKYLQYQQDLSINHMKMTEQNFQNEVVDDSWATEFQTNIESDFYKNESLAASELLSIDCRTSMCRVAISMPESVTNDVESSSDRFILENELLASISKDAARATFKSHPDGNGGLEYEIFLFRKGYQQPKPQDPLEGKSLSEKIEYIDRY